MITKRFAGIGSRETPPDAYRLQKAVAWVLAELGYDLSSGGCPKGGDDACYKAYYRKPGVDLSRQRIYISWDGMEGFKHDPERGIYLPQKFDNYEQAQQIALETRGSWNGLGRGGIAHMTRNVYQILGDDLNSPVDFVLCWGIPVGNTSVVKGGTGQATRLAVKHGIPIYNLYHKDVFNRLSALCMNVKLHHSGRRP